MFRIGVIGYGFRISGIMKMMMSFGEDIRITAITDIDFDKVRVKLLENSIDPETVRFYNDADEMMDNEKLDGIMVGTRCSLHAGFGIRVLRRNIPLYLEKPVATNMRELLELKMAYEKSAGRVVVSFPLRVTPLIRLAKDIIDSGKIGYIEHVQAVNNVPYGGAYYHSWYRDENETGGLFLQKATHDFDYINHLLGLMPTDICAITSKQIFKGDKPAGLHCADCNEHNTCPEGPYMMKYARYDAPGGDMCCFAKDTGNEDSGSALIRYSTGMHVSYSQNFFARKGAAARGARLLGYDGTLEFDWYKDELKVFMHNTERIETYKLDTTRMSHGGGDHVLLRNFMDVMDGKAESIAPLNAGLLSVLMCLKAKESAETDTFQKIIWP